MSRYSNDLRKRAADKLTAGVSIGIIAQELYLNPETIRKWKNKLKLGTLYDEIHIGGHPVVYDLEGLKKFVEQYPDKMLYEINDEFFGGTASTSGISDALIKMNFRLKKKSSSTENEVKKEGRFIPKN
jgi:transposase